MTRRVYGVENAAGMRVIDDSDVSGVVKDGRYGTTVIIGRAERGDTNTLIPLLTPRGAQKQIGSRYNGLHGPHAVDGFFHEAGTKGELWFVRVTDGDEIPSELTLYNRLDVPTAAILLEARNGGRWGGKARTMTCTVTGTPSGQVITYTGGSGDVTGLDGLTDVWKDASVSDDTTPGTSGGPFIVVGSTTVAGTPNAGTLTIRSDQDITDIDDGDTITVTLENDGVGLSAEIRDATKYPTTHFWLRVFLNGILILNYDNMGVDSAASDYFATVINSDASNYWIRATDLDTGTTADHRPARGWSTWTSAPVYSSTTGRTTLTDSTLGSTTDAMVGMYIVPNAKSATTKERLYRYKVVSNTATTVVVEGDCTDAGAANAGSGDYYRVEAPEWLELGYDGSTPSDSDWLAAVDVVSSPINRFKQEFMNRGLVKILMPGVASSTVLAGLGSYCEAKGYKGMVDTPSNYTDEQSAWNWLKVTVGASDNLQTVFPSFAYIPDPDGRAGSYVLTSILGDYAGEAAKVASDNEGYHHVAAGPKKVWLSRVSHLAFEWDDFDAALEFLEPEGIPLLRKMNGKWTVWGGRNLSDNTIWTWINQRDQILHYGHTLGENLIHYIFDLNDPYSWRAAKSEALEYFRTEYNRKRALRQDLTFDEACVIQLDTETTTGTDIESGDLNMLVKVCPAGFINRFNLYLGKGVIPIVEGRYDSAA